MFLKIRVVNLLFDMWVSFALIVLYFVSACWLIV